MLGRDASMTLQECELEIRRKFNFEFKTNFNFLRTHYGLRPGKIHLLIGLTSGGKSTAIRSILVDIYKNNSQLTRVVIWLSEEKTKDFLIELAQVELSDTARNNIHIISENDIPKDTPYQEIFNEIHAFEADILIFDNQTTSNYIVRVPFEQQCKFTDDFKREFEGDGIKDGVACLVVAHTKKDIKRYTTEVISVEDIRGNFIFSMVAQFGYVLQNIFVDGKRLDIISLDKKRGYTFKSSEIYHLNYNKNSMTYDRDQAINREKLLSLLEMARKEKRGRK